MLNLSRLLAQLELDPFCEYSPRTTGEMMEHPAVMAQAIAGDLGIPYGRRKLRNSLKLLCVWPTESKEYQSMQAVLTKFLVLHEGI